jgi:hypothetical protein
MRKAFDWKRSTISMLEVEAVPQSCIGLTLHEETCPLVHINNVQRPQKEDVKYLRLYLDRRLTWHKHISAKRKQLGITLSKMYWLLLHKCTSIYYMRTFGAEEVGKIRNAGYY